MLQQGRTVSSVLCTLRHLVLRESLRAGLASLAAAVEGTKVRRGTTSDTQLMQHGAESQAQM